MFRCKIALRKMKFAYGYAAYNRVKTGVLWTYKLSWLATLSLKPIKFWPGQIFWVATGLSLKNQNSYVFICFIFGPGPYTQIVWLFPLIFISNFNSIPLSSLQLPYMSYKQRCHLELKRKKSRNNAIQFETKRFVYNILHRI